MTFDAVPPGQVPTRMTPIASSGGRDKETDQGPGHEGHDDELGDDADEDFPRPFEDGLEILNGQGHAHAEHDDTQEPADIRLDPLQGLRPYGADDTDEDDENGHVVYQKITTLFQQKNLPIGIWGKRTKKTPSGTDRKVSKRQISIVQVKICNNPT